MLFFILGRRYIGIRVWRQACPPAKRQAALKHCSPLALALFSPALRGGAECRLMRRESSQECLWQGSAPPLLAFPWPPPQISRGPFPQSAGPAFAPFRPGPPPPPPTPPPPPHSSP